MNLDKMIREATGEASPLKEVIKLHGDASYRTYSRAVLENGKSFVLMQMPIGKASVSEEITNFNGTHGELPYINVARYLAKHGIKVPAIRRYYQEEHLMILEDLGDDLMVRIVEGGGEDVRRALYSRAIELLVDLQNKTANSESSECVALQRSFDSTLLNWEFDHFMEYGIESRTGVKVSMEDRDIFVRETRAISEEIRKFPYGFTHRDFQSRNILVVKNDLYLIDFQDALLGPAAYDLVALLRDSYVELSDNLLDELIAFYCKAKKSDLKSLGRQFDLITCQRKLKDAGRFVYIDRVKKNPNFLKYIPASLRYVNRALGRLPEYKQLYEVLKKYVPEWSS